MTKNKIKIITILFPAFLLLLASSFPASAQAGVVDQRAKNLAISIRIEDPETRESWTWDLCNDDSRFINNREIVNRETGKVTETVEVDIKPFIEESLRAQQKTIYSTLVDDITIKTGLTYSYSNQLVRIYKIPGSTTNHGIYYATNRQVYWRNPGAGVGSHFSPSSNTWNKTVNSAAGGYLAACPPYSLLDCDVHITGMSGYRTISVMCSFVPV